MLVVEDEVRLATAVARGLQAEGFEVDVAHTGPDGLWRAREGAYAAIVLDVLLPGLNGFALCRELRTGGDTTPVLMLTAKQGEHDEAEGLDLGADDFLRKPFSFVVLVARLRALVRRATNAPDGVLSIGDLHLDPTRRRCFRGVSELVLTARELDLLVALARRVGGVATKRELLAEVWGFDFDGAENIVEVYVGYLRTKIDRPFGRNSLQTVRTLGYRLVDDGRGVSGAERVAGWRWCRRATRSVRVRVTLLAAGLFAVALVVAAALLLHALGERLIGDVRGADEAALSEQAVMMRQLGVPSDAVEVGGSLTAGLQVMQFESDGRDFVLTVPGDVPVERALAGSTSSAGDGSSAAVAGTFRQALGPTDRLTISSLPIGAAVLSTASTLDEVRDTLQATTRVLWAVGPVLVAIVAGLSWLLAGRALRPVRLVTDRVAAIEASSLHERVPVPDSSDEIAVLARTMNQMLARLEDASSVNRRLVSDASHELRTPVAVMRAELEVARRDGDNDWPATSDALLAELDRLQGLVDDLLLLARADERGAATAARRPVDLVDLVNTATSRRRRVAVAANIVGAGTATSVAGDAASLGRALDHLVANAARSATTEVVVSVEAADATVAIHVDDDGPGIPLEARDLVVQRFVRLDDGRSRDEGGAGLGLPVAADVARAHGGLLEITESPLGGARVSLVLASTPQPMGENRTVRSGFGPSVVGSRGP